MAVFTVQNAIDLARLPLNDGAKDRYSDGELLLYAMSAYQMLLRYRPDMFIGSFASLTPWYSLTVDSTFPADDAYLPAVADYVTARAESKDDEHVLKERAQLFFSLFKSGIGA